MGLLGLLGVSSSLLFGAGCFGLRSRIGGKGQLERWRAASLENSKDGWFVIA